MWKNSPTCTDHDTKTPVRTALEEPGIRFGAEKRLNKDAFLVITIVIVIVFTFLCITI